MPGEDSPVSEGQPNRPLVTVLSAAGIQAFRKDVPDGPIRGVLRQEIAELRAHLRASGLGCR
jgi:hypothetical protein